MSADQLVVDVSRHIAEGELALLGRQDRVEHHLEQDVTQLFFQVFVPGAVRAEFFDGFQRLVGLFEQVTGEALMRLLPVPWATGPQCPHQLLEAHQLRSKRVGQGGHPQAGQVVGLDGAVKVVP